MSARTSAELIEGYVGRLRAELASVGAAEADDLVAEVRSLLVEAAGGDPERAAQEIERFGEPADLAAGILAERGLSPAGGMSAAEWWRMGVAVPIDIAIGMSVPIAAFFPLWSLVQMLQTGGSAVPIALAGLVALAGGSLWWPWYVWRPWRTGARPATAGMALTGLAVVRAPGFWKVVRARDLEALGLAASRRSRLSGLVTLAFALVLLAFFGGALLAQMDLRRSGGYVAELAGPEGEQIAGVKDAIEALYAGLATSGTAAPASVAACAGASYADLAARAHADPVVARDVGEPTAVASGVWTVEVTERTASGTRHAVFTVNRRVVLDPVGDTRDWVITAISGDGITASTRQ